MVALRTEAQALAHLRSVGGGFFRYALLDRARPPRGTRRARRRGVRPGRARARRRRRRRHRRRGPPRDAPRAPPARRAAAAAVPPDPLRHRLVPAPDRPGPPVPLPTRRARPPHLG